MVFNTQDTNYFFRGMEINSQDTNYTTGGMIIDIQDTNYPEFTYHPSKWSD